MENNNKILSIIIPVYNVAKYLERCVKSITDQINDSVEVILVDDGSKDDSGKLCDILSEKYGLITYHKKNGGLSSARNYGLKYASGKYVYFLDSDDMMSDGFLSCILPLLHEDKYDILEFKACWEKEENVFNPVINNKTVEVSAINALDRILSNKVGCQIWLRVYRRDLFENTKFPEGRNYEDIATIYYLFLNAKNVLLIDSEFYIYNITNISSITKVNSIKNLKDMYSSVNEFYENVNNFYQKNGLDRTYLNYFRIQNYIYIYLKLISLKDEGAEIRSEIRSVVDNSKVNIIKYRKYDIKRFMYYKFLTMMKKG